MSNDQPAAEIEHITFRYPGSADPLPVLDDVTFRIEADDYVGLIGPNGSGKTTLLKIMLGLLKPDSGRVRILGMSPVEARSRIGYVPQHAEIDIMVPATVLDVVLMGRLGRSSWGPRFTGEHVEKGMRALERTGVDDLARRTVSELSGGQRQRVLIARALASEAEILLLDEPTAGIDAPMEQSFHELLGHLNKEFPIVLVSHDIGFVSAHMKTIACLNRKLVCHGAPEVTRDLISQAYVDHGIDKEVTHDDDCPTCMPDEENPE